MALVGSYSVPGASGSVSYSQEYTNIDDLLLKLLDNTASNIQANDIRDSVYSLWRRIEVLSASVSVTYSVDYIRSTPMPLAVGGASLGTTFNGSVQDALDKVLYPYVAPGASLTSWSQKEYGDGTGYSFNLSWTATVNSLALTNITVAGVSKPLSPLSGTQLVTSTHSMVNPSSNPGTQQSYSMSVQDGTSTTNANTTVTWLNRIFWGRIDLSSVGNPNLTTNPGSASSVSSLVNSTVIKNLTGAGANSQLFGNLLTNSKDRTYTNIDGSGQHLIFAWPSNVAGAYTPTFTVNGLPNTAFTRVKNNWAFTNQYGFNGSDYEVWVSNTVQNSPLTVVVS